MKTEIAADRIAAYLATVYRVGISTTAFDLRINAPSDKLCKLYGTTGETCGLFITACNPYGKARGEEANEAAHSQLRQRLSDLTTHVIEGFGADPTGNWPQEKSFFALGIDKAVACQLGVAFGQDAIVWASGDGTPQLILLR